MMKQNTMHTISSFSTLENSAHFLFFHEWQPSSTKRTHATKRAAEAKEHGLEGQTEFEFSVLHVLHEILTLRFTIRRGAETPLFKAYKLSMAVCSRLYRRWL